MIFPVALFGGTEFVDPESYQSKAFDWLDSSFQSNFTDDELVQRYALASIYFATNGVSTSFTNSSLGNGVIFPWNNNENWLTAASECTWYGVSCQNGTGFVDKLEFVRMAFSFIPQFLAVSFPHLLHSLLLVLTG